MKIAEVLEVGGRDRIAGEQQPPGEHRTESVEEQVQRAERGPEEARRRHADLGVSSDDGDVGHERHLEPAAERVAAHLGDEHLRIADEVVVEVEGLAVDREPATLAGSPPPTGPSATSSPVDSYQA